jgi:predicted transcriptional regulator
MEILNNALGHKMSGQILSNRLVCTDKTESVRTEGVHVTISFKDIEMIKLKIANNTNKEIAQKLGITEKTVQRHLTSLPEIWPIARNVIFDIEKDEDVKAFLRGEIVLENPQVTLMRRRFDEGLHWGPAPYGYRKKNGKLVIMPKEAKNVKKLFEGIDQGKTRPELAKELELKLTNRRMYQIPRNPLYKGYVHLKEDTKRGKHEAIVDEKLWDRVQKKLRLNRPFSVKPPPYGFKYVGDRVIIDKEKAEDIRKMFKIQIETRSFTETARRMEWPNPTVQRRIKNPRYCGMKWKNGKLIKSDYPTIITLNVWNAANKGQMTWKEVHEKVLKERRQKSENKILAALGETEKTAPQLAHDTGLSPSTVRKRLKTLEEDKMVECILPKTKRIQGKLQPFKWRIRIK